MTTHSVTSLIDGEFLPQSSAGEHMAIVNPTLGTSIGEMQVANEDEVNAAVDAAKRAFDSGPWPRMSVDQRKATMLSVRDKLLENADELAHLESIDGGLPRHDVRLRHVPRMARNFDYYAALIDTHGDIGYRQEQGFLTFETLEPGGVAALIAPWNAPLALASMKIAACIALGNTCVLKPSEHTTLSLPRMVELMHEAGLPAGVVNVINGPGHTTGDALVRHKDVTRVSFTGGTATGRVIMAAASEGLKPVSLELGGKSANIIFDDADMDRALDGSMVAIYSNNGQQCLAGSRILVDDSVADEFIERFRKRTQGVRVGDPTSPDTEVGPLAFEDHLNRVLGFVSGAGKHGDEVLEGGDRLDQPGFFMRPAAIAVSDRNSPTVREEIFGPVASIMRFSDEDEAIDLANDSDFGLVSYVWTENLSRALRASQAIQAGTVWVNTPLMRDVRAPFGGPKESGIGREGGIHSLKFFGEPKTTTIATGKHPLGAMGTGR